MPISKQHFDTQFQSFRRDVERVSGVPFVSFRQGLPLEWESYKSRLRMHALDVLGIATWREKDVGSKVILKSVIRAIEFNETELDLRNNLVRWQNRYGHANRSHCQLLDALDEAGSCTAFERCLLPFYQGQLSSKAAFEELVNLAGKRYDLLAYLFFLRDAERFMPIAPQTFDEAFALLGTDTITSGRCSWENYEQYNANLTDIQEKLSGVGLSDVSLLDAHSFCWMLVRLPLQMEKTGKKAVRTALESNRKRDPGRHLDARERSIAQMRQTVLETIRQSTGVEPERQRKHKELRMSPVELDEYIGKLLNRQDNRCALTGIILQWHGESRDEQLLPSLDRIDSSGHYESGNLQVVCRFINFWKNASPDEEFRRLLALVRNDTDGA
jgi:hypothetical protein